jgi:hypothetical protein
VVLQKDITVDFNCTKNEAGVNFYEMNDQTGEWALLRNDLFERQVKLMNTSSKSDTTITNGRSLSKRNPGMTMENAYSGAKTTSDSIRLEGNIKGHQFPNLVYGLSSSKFGVYNCDQIYRIENQVHLSPNYFDASSKKPIKDQDMVCLIDKAVNASFSSGPRQITCNSKGENIFLLFTKDGQIYGLKSEKDKRVDLDQKEPRFPMENITDKVKTSDDLKHYLAI